MSDIVQKLWGFCHTLRHDGIDYGDYISPLMNLYLHGLHVENEFARRSQASERIVLIVRRDRAPDSLPSFRTADPRRGALSFTVSTQIHEKFVPTMEVVTPSHVSSLYALALRRCCTFGLPPQLSSFDQVTPRSS